MNFEKGAVLSRGVVESDCCGSEVVNINENDFCTHCKCECDVSYYACSNCKDTGFVEIMGGTDSDEWGVVDVRNCYCTNNED